MAYTSSRGRCHTSSNRSFLVETIVSGEYDFEKLDLEALELTSEALALSETPGKFHKEHSVIVIIENKLSRFMSVSTIECSRR